ncbi:MAG: ATP-binding protein [Bacteroidales bacterium]|nr:ATP-binding protein [Bacteroidales bacterium]
MIKREILDKLLQLSSKFPVVSVTGPRQSGKTTLIRSSFPDYRYVSLEDPDIRLLAQKDPRGFLGTEDKMIIDEIQQVPELFSYIQTITDEKDAAGQFIISGSQSFLLNERISQSLAGRVAILHLLPLSLTELQTDGRSYSSYEEIIFTGFYPRIYQTGIDPIDFYPNYLQTYIERDVRLLQNIKDLNLFIRFMKLCAGRTGQLLNLTVLSNDAGISVNTAKAWISVLEASFIIFLLQPHHQNFNKRLVKMPKLYFYDTGLACSLLELRSSEQLKTHYLLGGLFENFILAELQKNRFHQGLRNNCFFWRDHKGSEIDCIIDNGDQLVPIEIKASCTFSTSYFKTIQYWKKISGDTLCNPIVVYGGKTDQSTTDGMLIGWQNMTKLFDMLR